MSVVLFLFFGGGARQWKSFPPLKGPRRPDRTRPLPFSIHPLFPPPFFHQTKTRARCGHTLLRTTTNSETRSCLFGEGRRETDVLRAAAPLTDRRARPRRGIIAGRDRIIEAASSLCRGAGRWFSVGEGTAERSERETTGGELQLIVGRPPASLSLHCASRRSPRGR